MIPYAVYKVIHLVGVMMIYMSLGAVTLHVINGGGRDHSWRKPVMITHGIGLIFSLVAGFGLLARLGFVQGPTPTWVWLKVGIWLVFGGLTAVLVRQKQLAKPVWALTLVLGAFAAYLAGNKPF